jgi:hypothetical protein
VRPRITALFRPIISPPRAINYTNKKYKVRSLDGGEDTSVVLPRITTVRLHMTNVPLDLVHYIKLITP